MLYFLGKKEKNINLSSVDLTLRRPKVSSLRTKEKTDIFPYIYFFFIREYILCKVSPNDILHEMSSPTF